MNGDSGSIDVRELEILEKIENNGHLTQRFVKRSWDSVGINKSSVEKDGSERLVKIKNVDARRIKYLITPEGAREKSSLLYKRVENTINFYLDAKRVIKDKVIHLKSEGVKSVSVYGINHIAEVLFIVLKELGLELTYVVDDNKEGEVWFGYTIVNMDEFLKSGANIIILASFGEKEIDSFCKEQEGVKVVVLRD